MKKFFIFIIGLILGFVFFVFLSSWMKALPTDEETTPTVTEVKPADEPTVIKEIEVVEAVDYEKIEEDECFTTKEKNVGFYDIIKFLKINVEVDYKGGIYPKFEGETFSDATNISIDYRFYNSKNEYIKTKDAFSNNPVQSMGIDIINKSFHVEYDDYPLTYVMNNKDILDVEGIEICYIRITQNIIDKDGFYNGEQNIYEFEDMSIRQPVSYR